MAGLGLAGLLLEVEGDVRAFGEAADGVGEIDALVFFDKGEDVAAFVAAEAVENLLVGVDVEAGGFLLMEGAEGDEVGAGAFQGKERRR